MVNLVWGFIKNNRGMGIGRLLLEKLIEWCRENETIEKNKFMCTSNQ